MSSDDEIGEWEESLPELVQCEIPKLSQEGVDEYLDAWLQHSSVGQNVKALQEAQNKSSFSSPAKEAVQVPKGDINGKETPKMKRARKSINFGGEPSAKKSSSLPPLEPSGPISASSSSSSSSSNSNSESYALWMPTDEQVKALVQKVLVLELQQAGFDSVETRALEVFSDVTVRYISKFARSLRFILDRYAPLSVEMQPLWHMWLRSMHVSLPELPLFAHQDVIATRQRLAGARSAGEKVPHEHVPLAALVQENKQILEAFQHDQPIKLSRQRMQPPSSPPRDYSSYFDPTSADATATNFHQYSLDSFPPHLATLPQNLDPTDPTYPYSASFPFYAATTPSFEPDKANFYSFVAPNTLGGGSASPSIVPFPPRQ